MRLVARSTVVAGALAVLAIAAPAASARLNLEPSSGAPRQTAITTVAVRPNPDEQTAHATRVGPPILHRARLSDVAMLNYQEEAANHATAYTPPPSARYSSAGLNGYVSAPSIHRTVHITTHSNPFQWGDAAIGALGGFALSLLILGGALVITQRRGAQVPSAEPATS